MADVRILNMMKRGYVLNLAGKDALGNPKPQAFKIPSGTAITVDKGRFDAELKKSKALKALIDQKRLVVGSAAGTITTPHEDELHARTTKLDKPIDLQDTKDAETKDGKVKHEVKKVEQVEVDAPKTGDADAPKGGKRDS